MSCKGNYKATHSDIVVTYLTQFRQKVVLLLLLSGITIAIAVFAILQGTYDIPVRDAFSALFGKATSTPHVVITHIRMPRVVAAIICGWGLSLSGLCIQTLLKNPLGSPSTLGISQGAAFGAATAIVIFGTEVLSVTACAFMGAVTATVVILILARLKQLSVEAIILAGVALSALFGAATALIQYLASEIELAMVVFWTFGDVARSGWKEIAFLSGATCVAAIYILSLRWDLNALTTGEETAKGLGVNVERIRISGMLVVTLVSALATAFHGVIAFVGLIAPHMARRLVGDDHRLLIPFSSVLGAMLLLSADTVGRVLIGSGAMPVGVITSFLGAPVFLYLLIRGYK